MSMMELQKIFRNLTVHEMTSAPRLMTNFEHASTRAIQTRVRTEH